MFGCISLNMCLLWAEPGIPSIRAAITTPSHSSTEGGTLLAGGYSQNSSWFQLDVSVVKLSFHEPPWLSMSTVINDFCLCDLLAHGTEQWGIRGHGKKKAQLMSLWGLNLCLHLVLQLFTYVTSPMGQGMKNVSPEPVSAFPWYCFSPHWNPRARWARVQPPNW